MISILLLNIPNETLQLLMMFYFVHQRIPHKIVQPFKMMLLLSAIGQIVGSYIALNSANCKALAITNKHSLMKFTYTISQNL